MSPRSLHLLLLLVLGLHGCRTPATVDESAVLASLGAAAADGSSPLRSDDEVARMALLHNKAFSEALADLGIARAQILEANQFPNPTLSVLFPLGPKQLEFAAKVPLEAVWLRPRRVEAAQLDAEALAKTLTQNGLNLIRDVKVACGDLRLAHARVKLTGELNALLDRLTEIAEARVAAGDASELEVAGVRSDAAIAREQELSARGEAEMATEKLRHLTGAMIQLGPAPLLDHSPGRSEALLKQALAGRPDLRAAEILMEAEGKRVGLAQAQIFALTAVFDANGSGGDFEAGPGLEATLPLFNQNQGAIALADARFRKAALHYGTLRDQIAAEVRQARIGYEQAAEAHNLLESDVLPTLQTAIDQVQKAYEAGDVAYLSVLEVTRKRHEARLRQAQALADWQRAAAELERATGTTLTSLQP